MKCALINGQWYTIKVDGEWLNATYFSDNSHFVVEGDIIAMSRVQDYVRRHP